MDNSETQEVAIVRNVVDEDLVCSVESHDRKLVPLGVLKAATESDEGKH